MEISMKLSGRTAWAMGPASSANWWVRRYATSWIRLTVAEFMSEEKPASRNTVKPSLSDSWNQSRQVTRLPDQLWKYSWATIASTRWCAASVAVSALASTALELKMLRPLFSMAPMLKSFTATIMKMSRSYSRP
ncbi:hypothetical protein D3C84_774090 [compost metagenome]